MKVDADAARRPLSDGIDSPRDSSAFYARSIGVTVSIVFKKISHSFNSPNFWALFTTFVYTAHEKKREKSLELIETMIDESIDELLTSREPGFSFVTKRAGKQFLFSFDSTLFKFRNRSRAFLIGCCGLGVSFNNRRAAFQTLDEKVIGLMTTAHGRTNYAKKSDGFHISNANIFKFKERKAKVA